MTTQLFWKIYITMAMMLVPIWGFGVYEIMHNDRNIRYYVISIWGTIFAGLVLYQIWS